MVQSSITHLRLRHRVQESCAFSRRLLGFVVDFAADTGWLNCASASSTLACRDCSWYIPVSMLLGSDDVSALDDIVTASGVRLSVHKTFGIFTRDTSVLGESGVTVMVLVRCEYRSWLRRGSLWW